MQWLRDHEAYIDCANLTLKFYHDNQWLELGGISAGHAELSMIDLPSAPLNDDHTTTLPQFLRCNQMKKFVRSPDVETMAVFLLEDKLGNVHFDLTNDLQEAATFMNMNTTVTSLRNKLSHVPADTQDKFITMLDTFKDTIC